MYLKSGESLGADRQGILAPERPADFTPHHGQQVWMPTETEAAHMQWRTTVSEEAQDPLANNYFMPLERVAAYGMRSVFERFDIRSSRTETPIPNFTESTSEISHGFALTYPSSARHAQVVDEFANNYRETEKFRITHHAGRYEAPELLEALAAGQLLMSTYGEREPLENKGDTYYLNFFSHDITNHFLAWLCLPQDLSLRIRRGASDVIGEYNLAQNLHDLRRVEAARERVGKFGGFVDQAVNIFRMDEIIQGNTDRYNKAMSDLLNYSDANYAAKTLVHMADPTLSKVLSARQVW